MALGLAGLVGLFSCDGVVVVEENAPAEPAPLPSVSIVRASAAVVPDSFSWKASKDSSKGTLSCSGTNCTVQFRFATPLDKDTAQLSIWKYGLRLGLMQVYLKSGSTLTVGATLSKDELANKLVSDFAAFSQAKPDSVAKLGSDSRSRLVAYYAQRLLAGDTAVAGFPGNLPTGLSVDQMNAALVQAAARSGKGWAAAASAGSALDSVKVIAIAQDLIKKGQLQNADLGALQQPGKVVPPVDPQAPVLTVKNSDDATVPNSSASWLVQASATPASDIDSIQVNNQRFAASKCSVWVDLAVGGNPIKVSVLAKNGKRASDSFTITRKGKSNEPLLNPAPGTFERAQWVKISDTTTGSVVEWSRDGNTWNLYKDSLLVAVPETLQVRSSVTGRDPAKVTAVYVIKNVEPVQFDPKPGRFAVAQTVNFRSATPGASYECSFQGGSWSACSGRYTVQQSGMLRVRTSRAGMTSAQDSATYLIDVQAAGAPTLSLVSGLYDGDQSVIISCSVTGCQLDWSTDSSVWTPYTAPVKVDRSQRLYARSTASGSAAVTWADYAIALAPPKFEPEGGTFAKSVNLNVAGSRTGALVFVSTDSSKWTAFDKSIQIATNTKVWAWDSVQGMARSRVVSAQYRIQTAKPRFEPAGGTFQDVQKVVVSDSTPGALIQVSSDSSAWSEYTGAVTVDRSGRLWARATAAGMEPSPVASADFSLSLAAPELSLATGTFPSSRKVGLKATAGAEIRYTLDGTDPTASSSLYTDSIVVGATSTLKAIAQRTGWKTSSVASAVYTITGGVAAPAFSRAAGTFPSAIKVAISTTTSGADIHYTTDGSEPTSASTLYTDSVTVSTSQTLKAVALKSGWAPSTVTTAAYTITGTVSAPTASVPAGSYPSAFWVKLSTSTSGAQIRYTLDGQAPTDSSALYADSVKVSTSQTLRAAAFKAGWATSATATYAYTITGTVAQPTASVATGTYTAPIWVKLSTTTAGAQIRYTLDGTVPDTSAPLFADSVQVSTTRSLKAVAFKSGWATSGVASFAYTITGTVSAPTSSVPAGTFTAPFYAKLATSTAGAQIRYTLDGQNPTDSSALLTDSVLISSSATLKAAAFKAGWATSAVSSYAYTITGTVATPAITPATGTYTTAQSVTISTTTAGASIYYTTDGTVPTTASTLYAGAFSVPATTTVRAIAVKTGWATSAAATSTLTITGKVATPDITPATGTYTAAQNVTIATTTAGASIYYTTDGTVPTTASTPYAGAFTVASSTMVQAIAVKTGWTNSAVDTSMLTITGTVATPVITPVTGTYSAAQSVTIATTTAGASIYYTTDGTVPTTASTLYAGAFSVSSTTTVRAIAVKTGWANSAGVTSTITISLGTVAAPVFSLAAGSYATGQRVTITCATASAQIRYTTDGTAPTAASPLYSTPISVSSSMVITAAGFRTNYTPSAAVARSYTITDFSIPWQTGITYGTLLDSRDGQTYRTVKIGAQTWMAQALNYSAGGTIGTCSGGTSAGCDKFGRLYTWSETRGIAKSNDSVIYGGTDIEVTGICPAGYHIPSLAEWKTLESYVDPTKANSGTMLMSTAGWSAGLGSDDVGFRSVPAGGYVSVSGYYAQGTANYFWSATEMDAGRAYGPSVYSSSASMGMSFNNKYRSTTLRCLAN